MRKTMVTKCIRKLTFVMMELLILILLVVQANELAPTPFCPYSPPIQLSYSSELDEAKGLMEICLTRKFENCESFKKTWPLPDLEYELCIHYGHLYCLNHIKVIHDPVIDCFTINCKPKSKIRPLPLSYVRCLLKCYTKYIKKHPNVIHTKNH
jgi:hypothetical protein